MGDLGDFGSFQLSGPRSGRTNSQGYKYLCAYEREPSFLDMQKRGELQKCRAYIGTGTMNMMVLGLRRSSGFMGLG